MVEEIDCLEIPYIQDILNYLPISPTNDEDIISYIQNVSNLVSVNYKYGQYQFAYFGIHLLYMTYIYCTIWKISKINPSRYSDAVVFARTYNNRDDEIDIENICSIFEYSLIPEKDISKVFKIIDLDKSQISSISGLVSLRNEMAHASGKFEILTEDSFRDRTHSVMSSMKCIHLKMNGQIRKWFEGVLIGYCRDEFSLYSEVKDIINEQLIENFKLSMNELLVCNNMSMRNLISKNREYKDKLRSFKAHLSKYCSDYGYSQDY